MRRKTGKPSLILTRLLSPGRWSERGRNSASTRGKSANSTKSARASVANYERLAKLDPEAFGAVIAR